MFAEGRMSIAAVSNITGNRWVEELERLFAEQHQLVYRTAYALTGSAQDAEDVLQTVFLRLLAREIPPDMKSPEPYLYRAAFNLSMDVIRSRRRHLAVDDDHRFARQKHFAEQNDEEEIDNRLHRAIAELHPAAAQIVILRYVHDKPLADIARMMGTSRSTIAVSLFRSRARLKKLMQGPGKEKHESPKKR
jgi:RNA polymerase sigma-70 factor, ECF subfamily